MDQFWLDQLFRRYNELCAIDNRTWFQEQERQAIGDEINRWWGKKLDEIRLQNKILEDATADTSDRRRPSTRHFRKDL